MKSALAQKPCVLADRHGRVIEARPDRIEDEIAGIADGKHAEQSDDAQAQSREALAARGIMRQQARPPAAA
jgi:hypothetical protein